MANRRWREPSNVEGRQEFRKLRRELRKAGSIAQLDSLCGRRTPNRKKATQPASWRARRSGDFPPRSPRGKHPFKKEPSRSAIEPRRNGRSAKPAV